ncbi:MAG TPA: amino acid adenylation domain-containing protein [Candidatus Angelobacter sp.]
MNSDPAAIHSSSLSPAKQQLLKKLLSASSAAAGSPTIVRQARRERYPLSFAQQRLWFLQQLQPSTPFYTIVRSYRLTGFLDKNVLQKSLEQLMRRHDSLRTTFQFAEDGPVQVIADEMALPLEQVDLSSLSGVALETSVANLIRGQFVRPFNLCVGPLVRFTLAHLNEQEHIFILCLHHIVTDDWSMSILFRELSVFYNALHSGFIPQLPELPVRYVDFALREHDFIGTSEFEAQLDYWKWQLAENSAALNLPQKVRPAIHVDSSADLSLRAAGDLSLRIHEFCRQEKCTLFVFLLAAFEVLLARLTGEYEFSLGTVISTRDSKASETVVGFMTNTVVLRLQLHHDPSFKQVVRRAQDVLIEAHQNKDVPFEYLVRSVQSDRSNAHAPLFQAIAVLQNAYEENITFEGIQVQPVPGHNPVTPFDLSLVASNSEAGLEIALRYKTDVFEADTVRRLIVGYEKVFQWALAAPDREINSISLLTEQELQQLTASSHTETPEYLLRPVHQLFEQQARITPEAVAVSHAGQRLSYRELNQKANQLARYLRGIGIGPETLAGICMERSPDAVTAMLAMLKIGGAYVPLDPAYPAPRLQFMVEDARLRVVLTHKKVADDWLPENLFLIYLDWDWPQVVVHESHDLSICFSSEITAYVIYTSGSTGKPKGVAVTQRSLTHSTQARWHVYQRRPTDYLLLSSFSFDSSVAGLFWALSQGGTLHIPAQSIHNDVKALVELIGQNKVTHLLCLPGFYNQILEEGGAQKLSSLEVAIVAGESFSPELVDKHFKVLPEACLYNEYGPTEGTVWSTVHRFNSGIRLERVPIGKPVPDVQIYVLSSGMEPVFPGVAGEIYIGGSGLARGYWNHPELTAERFLPDPFRTETGGRLYRTGDVGRWRPDGELEFLGRNDQQVKIRGYRIELGEIETTLQAHSQVKQAMVLLREDKAGQKALAAYLIFEGDQPPDPDELRQHLKRTLPEYMAPSHFIFLSHFPLGANGKVDRSALPAPHSRSNTYRAPRTVTEEILCEIFAEVLDLSRVGIQDNFFDLGGHSLLANRLVNHIRRTMGVDLPLRAVFESATVADLAKCLKAGAGSALPPLEPQPRPRRLPLSYAQQRLWFIDQLEGTSTEYNMPDALHLEGELDLAALRHAVNAIVQRHESLRTRFIEENGEALQIVMPQMAIEVPVEDLSGFTNEEREERVITAQRREWNEAFDLAQGPLLRIRLLKVGEREYILLRCFHHIVSDGWSMGVLNRELATFYESFRAGRADSLPPLSVQYADYALWQRRWLDEQALNRSLDYWKQQLADIPEQLGLMEDYPRLERQTFEAGFCRLTLPATTTDGLKRLSRSGNATLFMTLVAAYAALLHRYSRQNDIVIGTPVANRSEQQLEQLIGIFLNSLALRVKIHNANSFREVLAAVRATALAAYAHQDLPFEKLVEVLSPRRAMNRAPIFQCMFLLQNIRWQAPELSGMKVEPVRSKEVRTYFDLELYAQERESQIEIRWVYNRNLFEHSRMEQMTRGLGCLLESIVANPEGRVGELNILNQEERLRLLGEWNATAVEYPRTEYLPEMFERQAGLQPHCVATTFGDKQLTYEQLNEKSNQLARFLRTLGVRPDCFVGICMDRSMEMLIAVLGILKAGGAYVPLDPGYPEERLRFMTEDAGLDILLTRQSLLACLPKYSGRVICLDSDWPQVNRDETDSPPRAAISSNAVYVIYTSGSTGWPKGVVVSHGAACNQISWMKSEFPLNALHRVLQRTSISFDASIAEIFLALSTGAELVVADSRANDADYLVKLIAERKITYIDLPPPLLDVMLAHPRMADCSSLQYVICGGETLPLELSERMRAVLRAKMYNLYGPTEATVQSTFHHCAQGGGRRTIPIGKAIANTQIYLLNDLMQPVPPSAPGEIYIGGEGLAQGYWRRMDTTAERFLPNPFSQIPGARLYRTGDLAIQDTQGRLEFLDRVDHQVKIRGYRIELGEIEAILNRNPKVQAAVAAAHKQGSNTRLVGYVVAYPGSVLNIGELHSYLKKELPDYARPGQLMLLKELPLTVSGKIDRKNLPFPEGPAQHVFTPPRTPVELQLAGIWQEFLGVVKIGLDDNFFDLGGHSLLIARVRIKLRDTLGQDLPIIDFFAFPTIRTMARRLEQPEQGETLTENQHRAHLQRQYFLRQRQPRVLREQ